MPFFSSLSISCLFFFQPFCFCLNFFIIFSLLTHTVLSQSSLMTSICNYIKYQYYYYYYYYFTTKKTSIQINARYNVIFEKNVTCVCVKYCAIAIDYWLSWVVQYLLLLFTRFLQTFHVKKNSITQCQAVKTAIIGP